MQISTMLAAWYITSTSLPCVHLEVSEQIRSPSDCYLNKQLLLFFEFSSLMV